MPLLIMYRCTMSCGPCDTVGAALSMVYTSGAPVMFVGWGLADIARLVIDTHPELSFVGLKLIL